MDLHAGLAALDQATHRWNAGDVAGYLKLYSHDAVLHGYAGVEPGFAAIKAFYEDFFVAFPHTRLVVEDVMAAGDKVTCRFVVHGRHEGPFMGLPATQREFSLPGITILRFAGDQCVERWSQADFLSLMQQLGAIPG